MSEKFTLYDDSKYENHATNELPLASKNIGKKEELSKAFIKPIILDRNKYLNDDNWELGLDYTDFTGSDVQNAFGAGLDAAIKEIKVEIKRRRNESTWAEYNEALDDMFSFINTMGE